MYANVIAKSVKKTQDCNLFTLATSINIFNVFFGIAILSKCFEIASNYMHCSAYSLSYDTFGFVTRTFIFFLLAL